MYEYVSVYLSSALVSIFFFAFCGHFRGWSSYLRVNLTEVQCCEKETCGGNWKLIARKLRYKVSLFLKCFYLYLLLCWGKGIFNAMPPRQSEFSKST